MLNHVLTVAEALKIAEAYSGCKLYQYAESTDKFIFSPWKPGEVVYGPRPYTVSKITGEAKMYMDNLLAPWPFGKWHAVTDDLRGKKNFIRRFLDKLKGSQP